MFKKIVGFGDSWMWGDELLDPRLVDHEWAHPVFHENTPYRESRCFLGLLGEHYGVPVENFGIAGGSMQSSIWTYLWWLENETLDPSECLILVAHTDPNRTSFYNPQHVSMANDEPWNKFVHSAWVHSGADCFGEKWNDLVKRFFVLSDSRPLHKLTAQQTVTFFDGQYHALSRNVMQFYSMYPHYQFKVDSMLWEKESLREILGDDESLYAPDKHPNEKGHQVIGDRLIIEIDRAIISK